MAPGALPYSHCSELDTWENRQSASPAWPEQRQARVPGLFAAGDPSLPSSASNWVPFKEI